MATESDYELLLNGLYQSAGDATEAAKVRLHKPANVPPLKRILVGNLWLVFHGEKLVRLEVVDNRNQIARMFKVEPAVEAGP